MSRGELSSACPTAAEALQVLSNVNPNGISIRIEASAVPTSISNSLSNRTIECLRIGWIKYFGKRAGWLLSHHWYQQI